MWIMVWLKREMQSLTNYILGTDRRIFRNVSDGDPSHNLDNYLILERLRSSTLMGRAYYIGWRTRLPL